MEEAFMSSTQRPNIVFVFADQLRYQSVGYADDPNAHTPNLDRLAKEITNFANAVISMPVCAAARSSLWTGKYVTSTGMVINELRINPHHQALGHVLTEGGYQTGYIGKWHLWANELGNHNDPKNSFVPPGPYRLGFDGYWAGYNFHHDYYNAYYHTDSPEPISYGDGVYEPDGQTDLAIDFLTQQVSADRPFALFLSYGTPHDPWTPDNVPARFYDMFAEVDFPVPPNYRAGFDEPYGDAWSNIPKSPDQIAAWMRVYYAMTANLDWNIGRLRAALDDLDLTDDTLFIFTSDHGEMFGAHGRMKKNIFYEEAARVPLLMRWPGVMPAGLVADACLSNVDLMPTLLGLVDLPIPAEVEGMDLSHLARGEAGPEPDFAFLQNTGACAAWENGHEWRAIRDKQYTYARYKIDGKERLFDNLADPYQMHNLAEGETQSPLVKAYRAKMAAKMAVLNDTFPDSLWYKAHWISADRRILRTATMTDSPPPP
jgi:arylsulfatase A-like enzyme